MDTKLYTGPAPERDVLLSPSDSKREVNESEHTTDDGKLTGISHLEGCPVANDPFRQENEGSRGSRKKAIRRLTTAIVLCFVFMIAEVIGGRLSGSLAIITDATHLLSDVAGFLISLFAITWSRKVASASMSYGYHRAEILGALLSISLVWAITFYLLVEAFERLRNPVAIDGKAMFVVALMGVVVNAIIGLVLHERHHEHDTLGEGIEAGAEGHGHHHSAHDPNINVQAAFIHAVGDLIQSIGVLVASLLVWYRPEWRIADLLCTIVFSVLVLGSTWFLARDVIHILMEGTPRDICPRVLRERLAEVDGVKEVHDLHVWSLAPGKASATVHVVIDWERQRGDQYLYHRVLLKCQRIICGYNVHHVTIQIDPCRTGAVHCRTDCCGSDDNFITSGPQQ